MLLRADVLTALALPIGVGLVLHASPTPAPTAVHVEAPAAVSFAQEIMPIFEKHCWECHSESNPELGLNLQTYEGVMAGSDYGTVVEPGNPDGSLIIDMISSGDMPQDADPMPADELDLIRTWIQEGAENN